MKNTAINVNNSPAKTSFFKVPARIRLHKSTFIDLFSFLLIFLFIYAASSKMIDYQKFTVQLGQSPMLTGYADFVAWFVPGIEILIALLLSIPKLRLIGLFASLSLMVMFTTYIIVITNFSEYVPCSCGGILQNMTWNQHLIFNLGFVLFSILGILMYPKAILNRPGK